MRLDRDEKTLSRASDLLKYSFLPLINCAKYTSLPSETHLSLICSVVDIFKKRKEQQWPIADGQSEFWDEVA